ncbi:MAG: hypothetical protein QXK89_10530 [Candidatus Bathyarchaeia archaeon]
MPSKSTITIFLCEKPKEEAEREERKSKHKTPTEEEMLEKATELYMKERVVEGLPAITPEESELKEGGYYEGLRF